MTTYIFLAGVGHWVALGRAVDVAGGAGVDAAEDLGLLGVLGGGGWVDGGVDRDGGGGALGAGEGGEGAGEDEGCDAHFGCGVDVDIKTIK